MNAENVAFLPLNISSSQQATGVGDGVCVLVGVAVLVGVEVNVGQGVCDAVLVGVFVAVLLGVCVILNLVMLII